MIEEKKFYNALAVSCQGEYKKLSDLYSEFGNWKDAYLNCKIADLAEPEKEWQKLLDLNIKLVLPFEPEFPKLLKEIPWPPFGLYFLGDASLLNTDCIAMVGTRKATNMGLDIAGDFAKKMANFGLTIVSGLALGIDAASHIGALEAKGKTIAILANGLDNIYPRQNEQLAEKILASGGLIGSEYPIKTVSLPRFFIARNRIVSGLSRGVLVIESPKRSGTLSTARFAIEQNREVFVIPGAITNPNYEGSNNLIKNGAALVSAPEDILSALGIESGSDNFIDAEKISSLDKNQQMIFTILNTSEQPAHIDEIIDKTQLADTIVNECLALLVIEGLVSEDAGRYYIPR